MKIICLVFLLVSVADAGIAAEVPVSLESAAAVELCATCKPAEAQFLLAAKEQTTFKKGEMPVVEAVYFGNLPRQDLLSAITPSLELTAKNAPRALKLSVDTPRLMPAGTYDVYLALQPKTNPLWPRLKVQVMRPAPKVAAIPKLIIDRTYYLPYVSRDETPELFLDETTRKSPLTMVKIRKVNNASHGAIPVSGSLEFPKLPETLKPEGQRVEYRLTGDYPLGATTGAMQVFASEASDPVAKFDFEVNTRLWKAYIAIFIFAGLLCSWILKVKLQKRIELGQAKLDAEDLLEISKGIKDEKFRQEFAKEFEELKDALKNEDVNTINEKKKALDDKWRASLTKFTQERQKEQDELDKLLELTAHPWNVPANILEAVRETDTKLRSGPDSVSELLRSDQVTKAGSVRKNISESLGERIKKEAITWQDKMRQAINNLKDKNGISADIQAKFSTAVQSTLLPLLDKIKNEPPLAKPEDMCQALRTIEAEYAEAKRGLDWLADALRVERTEADSAINLAKTKRWGTKEFEGVTECEDRFLRYLETLADTPPEPETIVKWMGELHAAWSDTLQKPFGGKKPEVDSLISSRQYLDALRKTLDLLLSEEDKALGIQRGPVVPRLFIPAWRPGERAGFSAPTRPVRTILFAPSLPEPVKPSKVTTARQLRKDKATQSAILGGILAALGYGLYSNSFVGTFADFMTIFFWAFGLDLTWDTVNKLLAKKGGP